MSEPNAEAAPDAPTARHASWLELFFDLVVVAAVALVAHRLHEPSWSELGISLLLFGAIWYSWMSFTLYANVQGDAARAGTLIAAMAGIGVMAAAIPEADGERAVPFIVAFIALRILASRTWQHTGSILLAWPGVHFGAALVPWIISIWVDGNGRYVLWAVGLALDLLVPMLTWRNATEDQVTELMKERLDEGDRRRQARSRNAKSTSREPARAERHVVQLEAEHLTERLGLFVIIVLGESVAQMIHAASELAWDRDLVVVSVGGLLLVSGLWWLTFQYGFTASPHDDIGLPSPALGRRFAGEQARSVARSTPKDLPARIALPVHLATTACLMVVAAGLGSFAAHPDSPAPSSTGALLCGGIAAYFAMTTIAGIAEGAPKIWVWLWGVPAVLVAAALAVFVETLTVPGVVWLLVLVVAWHAMFGMIRPRLA